MKFEIWTSIFFRPRNSWYGGICDIISFWRGCAGRVTEIGRWSPSLYLEWVQRAFLSTLQTRIRGVACQTSSVNDPIEFNNLFAYEGILSILQEIEIFICEL